MARAAAKEQLVIEGPAGALEALLESPEDAARGVAVICHPHPQHQGTMTNKVVSTLARAFNELGLHALRFNFRGVGASEGSYADGDGEVEDALAVCAYARERWPDAELWLAGFSFGGVIAARAADRAGAAQLVCVAPAVNVLDAKLDRTPGMPWLIVQGSADEIVPAEAVEGFVEAHQPGPELIMLDGVGHFFHGQIVALRDSIVGALGG